MNKIFDFLMSFFLSIVFAIPMVFIALAIRLDSKGPVLYWSNRVGINGCIFKMPKFRSMQVGSPMVATHLLSNPDSYLSSVGRILRKTSLDELPQLWSVLKGDMSFVGPRPALFNQDNLILLRREKNIDKLLPGITGWAQVNGRDELSIPDKVALDVEYFNHQSFWFDMKIIWMTFLNVVKQDGVSH